MADNETLKKTLRHYIDLEFYANSVDSEMQSLLKELIKECDEIIDSQPSYNTKAEYSAAYRLIKEKINEFGDKLNKRLEEEAEIIMNEEEEFLGSLYGKAIMSFAGISLAKILFASVDGRDTASQFAERTQKNLLRTYDNSLRAGYLFGQSSKDIKSKVDGNLKQVSNGMQAGIQTAIPSFAKTTDRIFFLNNNAEVVYCAVLDGRTCIVCGNDNGLHFKSISEAPSIPQHARCRCCYIKASEIKEPLPTYEEYIKSLSEEEQYYILGKNRYELWKNYNITLDKFVNNGRKLRLDEIDLPSNLLINNSGARSEIVNILSGDDILKNAEITEKYYDNIRSKDNSDFISKISKNSGMDYQDVEKIVNHVFKERHTFENGITKYFDTSEEIVKAFERLKTKEFTNTDLLLLKHELTELTYMKNKKYNIYEIAHEMANKKYNWEEVIKNENLSKN